MAVGPIAREVSAMFDDHWNCVLAVPISALTSRGLPPMTSRALAATSKPRGNV